MECKAIRLWVSETGTIGWTNSCLNSGIGFFLLICSFSTEMPLTYAESLLEIVLLTFFDVESSDLDARLMLKWMFYVRQVVGTMGYAAPEYIQTGRLTSKNDVWSYGVFLYELITGRRPLDRNRPKGEQKLLEWIKPYLSNTKKFQLILDPRLDKKQVIKSAQRLATIANRCLVKNPKNRPKMSEVLGMVNEIVESSSSGSNSQLPLKNVSRVEVSQDIEMNNTKKRSMDQKSRESNWFFKIWRPKLLRT